MTVTDGFLGEGGVFDEPLPAAPLGDPADCIGQDAEAGLIAWHHLLNHITWRRLRCKGGELTVTMHSDPTLFAGIVTRVVAFIDRRPVATATVPPEGSVPLRVPLTPVGGTCTVRFVVSPTRVPAEAIPGAADERRLGVHFDSFAFEARP